MMLILRGVETVITFVVVGVMFVAVMEVTFVIAVVTFMSVALVNAVVVKEVKFIVVVVISVALGVMVVNVGFIVAFSDVITVDSSDDADADTFVDIGAVVSFSANIK